MATDIKIERRYIKATDLRMIMPEADMQKSPMMQGMAALYNVKSEEMMTPKGVKFREIISPGFFTNALKNGDIRCLVNHESRLVLGRTTSGTLRLSETQSGLAYETDLPETSYSRDLQISIARGDITQNSFGFITAKDSWDIVNGEVIRTLIECKELKDVSPVTFPAYPETTVAMRSMDSWQQETNGAEADPTALISTMRKRLDLKAKLMEV